MKALSSFIVAAFVFLLWGQSGLLAHHAFTAEFDAEKPVSLSGTVTKLEWTNPHAHFHLDVSDGGAVVSWNLELGSPNALMRRGWTRSALKVGDKITVTGYLAKDGSHLANARTVTLSDGRTVFAGSSLENKADK